MQSEAYIAQPAQKALKTGLAFAQTVQTQINMSIRAHDATDDTLVATCNLDLL